MMTATATTTTAASAPALTTTAATAAVSGAQSVVPGANALLSAAGTLASALPTSSAAPPAARGPSAKSWLAAAAAPPRGAAPVGHLLHRTFHFSYVRRTFDKRADDYAAQIKSIASVSTVEEFWQVYVHLHRVSKLAPLTDYFLFQDGVLPMWEDERNRRGGRLTLRVQKMASPRAFEDLCLALIGEQFDTDDICGIACSVRLVENYLSIWLRDAKDRELLAKVEAVARRALDISPKHVLRDWTFKPHHAEQGGPS